MLRVALVFLTLTLSFGILRAQEDDMPAPSSQPKTDSSFLIVDKGHSGLSKYHKRDLSQYLIEPDISLAIFNAGVNVGISPYLGHKIAKNLYAGGGLTYMYTGFKNIPYQDATGATHFNNASWHTFGGGAYLQYNIWRGLFVRGRVEVLHRWIEDIYDPETVINRQNNTYSIALPKIQKTIPTTLVGIGYNLLEGRNFFFPMSISYNLLHNVTNNVYAVYPSGFVLQLGYITVF
jgi:hypothetical protein